MFSWPEDGDKYPWVTTIGNLYQVRQLTNPVNSKAYKTGRSRSKARESFAVSA